MADNNSIKNQQSASQIADQIGAEFAANFTASTSSLVDLLNPPSNVIAESDPVIEKLKAKYQNAD